MVKLFRFKKPKARRRSRARISIRQELRPVGRFFKKRRRAQEKVRRQAEKEARKERRRQDKEFERFIAQRRKMTKIKGL